ncbi:lipoprotein [Sporosalibacterium faouarense]|uniref:LptM family lipoprotein n=1 Tax=Sporosalibacterium faouarense TaxID=516123 RepID=UPI00192AB72A|nr:hypothetical protein [Sporosalibacterium faouarense]
MKRILMFLMVLVTALSLVACGEEDMATYKNAVNKTNEIMRGQSSYEITVNQEFNIDGLTPEEIKDINYFKKMVLESRSQFNSDKKKVIAHNYSNFGGMGFDTDFYMNNDEVFMKMPIIGKYMNLQGLLKKEDDEANEQIISQDTIQKIKDNWIGILNEEDVVSGEKSLLSTEEGEVKATLFSISLTDKQIKKLVNNTINDLLDDNNLTRMMEKFVNYEEKSISLDEIVNKIRESISSSNITDFKYQVYIDIDGCIVQSNMTMEIEYPDAEIGEIKSQEINMITNVWDIEEEQSFNFPSLTEDNTLQQGEINQGIPFMFEDIFKDEKGGK